MQACYRPAHLQIAVRSIQRNIETVGIDNRVVTIKYPHNLQIDGLVVAVFCLGDRNKRIADIRPDVFGKTAADQRTRLSLFEPSPFPHGFLEAKHLGIELGIDGDNLRRNISVFRKRISVKNQIRSEAHSRSTGHPLGFQPLTEISGQERFIQRQIVSLTHVTGNTGHCIGGFIPEEIPHRIRFGAYQIGIHQKVCHQTEGDGAGGDKGTPFVTKEVLEGQGNKHLYLHQKLYLAAAVMLIPLAAYFSGLSASEPLRSKANNELSKNPGV